MCSNIAGIDEVGRGSLFGPVFAASIILSKKAELKLIKAGLKDSKKLSSKKRNLLVPIIKSLAKSIGVYGKADPPMGMRLNFHK